MILWLSLAYAANAPVVDRIAAVVNNEVVALSDVYELGRDFVIQRCPATVGYLPFPDTPEAPVPEDPAAPSEPGADGGGAPSEPPESGAPETGAPEAPAAPAPVAPEPSAKPISEVERCAAQAELEILDALIRRALIRQELSRLELDVTAADVDQAIDRTVRQYQLPDRQALKTEVEASGKRWDQYRDELLEFLRTQAFQGRVLAPRVTVTNDEMNDFYQRTARKVTRPVVKVSGLGIVVPPGSTPEQDALIVAQATELSAALNRNEIPWEDAVRLYDAGASGMFAGQEFTPNSIVEPLATAIFSAPIGVVQPPVRMDSPNGSGGQSVLFILRVDEKAEKSEVAPFEEVKDQIRDQVFSEKLRDAEEEWYQRARRESAVDVKLKAG